jgi:hypothetical protein
MLCIKEEIMKLSGKIKAVFAASLFVVFIEGFYMGLASDDIGTLKENISEGRYTVLHDCYHPFYERDSNKDIYKYDLSGEEEFRITFNSSKGLDRI